MILIVSHRQSLTSQTVANRNTLPISHQYSLMVLVRSTKCILRPKPTLFKDATLFFPTLDRMTILKLMKSHYLTALPFHLGQLTQLLQPATHLRYTLNSRRTDGLPVTHQV